ncbi:PIG-L deacetylase family protein [Arsukibacterium indicum]|uniref:PIG-L family deacetylase n=1 Tax=Arsukibacterium indicum TaxID=2848612 RepID=A0ABS6MGE4_9GAMM|nr:PIG-L deacetylase family protein [Arsukibacterium indicum]MBV2127869.1 PIG-L family deacetylase [Arsukibacterium indicum]
MKTVVVVAAHPDDEVLGCAGTIALHSAAGDRVHVIFMADGEKSRSAQTPQLASRKKAAHAAAGILGVQSVRFLDFADNAMDSVPLLSVNQALEKALQPLQPELVYTHFGGDLNIDHRLTYQAVLTACRPQPGQSVRRICCFEVPSSTEWSAQQEAPFRPQLFVDISSVLQQVNEALQCYAAELRPWPHSRSLQAISLRQQWRGSNVGLTAAEAFMVEREIRLAL